MPREHSLFPSAAFGVRAVSLPAWGCLVTFVLSGFSFSETESHPVDQTDLEFARSNVNLLVLR